MSETNLPRYGRWRAEKELGRGGQGVVYLAVDASKDQYWEENFLRSLRNMMGHGLVQQRHLAVQEFFAFLDIRLKGTWTERGALKVLHPGPALTKAQERRRNELSALRSVQHPNPARILDSDSNATWIVYELFEHGTLQQNPARFKGDVLGAINARVGLVEGVAKLHDAKCVRRDIKPANIFFGADGRLVLGDFGLVYGDGANRVTSSDEKVGTTDWMPTWAIGNIRWDEVKPSFDVFALGKLLWALVTADLFLQLHYFRNTRWNLAQRFPDDDRMKQVNEWLGTCIVEREEDCLPDACSLKRELEALARTLAVQDH